MLRGLVTAMCLMGAAVMAHPSTIRVLIVDGVQEAKVELTGSYQVADSKTEEYVGRGLFGKRYPLQAVGGGLAWGEEFPGVYQVTIVPESSSASCIVDGVPYKGILHAYNIEGKLAIVNEVSVEDYCRSSLSSVVRDEPMPLEVLTAMAITTRTHALYDIQKRKGAEYHVVASDVGYEGERSIQVGSSVAKAVRQTERIVLDLPSMKGGVFPALWTRDCAGRTAPHHRMFRGELVAPMPGVVSAHADRHRTESAWKTTLNRTQLGNALGVEGLLSLSLAVESESGKVFSIQVETARDTQDLEFAQFQKLVGADRIRSSEFQVEFDHDEVTFSGFGEGHGVGVCLYTAERMATRGDKASDILGLFYPEASLKLAAQDEERESRPLARRYPSRFSRSAL